MNSELFHIGQGFIMKNGDHLIKQEAFYINAVEFMKKNDYSAAFALLSEAAKKDTALIKNMDYILIATELLIRRKSYDKAFELITAISKDLEVLVPNEHKSILSILFKKKSQTQEYMDTLAYLKKLYCIEKNKDMQSIFYDIKNGKNLNIEDDKLINMTDQFGFSIITYFMIVKNYDLAIKLLKANISQVSAIMLDDLQMISALRNNISIFAEIMFLRDDYLKEISKKIKELEKIKLKDVLYKAGGILLQYTSDLLTEQQEKLSSDSKTFLKLVKEKKDNNVKVNGKVVENTLRKMKDKKTRLENGKRAMLEMDEVVDNYKNGQLEKPVAIGKLKLQRETHIQDEFNRFRNYLQEATPTAIDNVLFKVYQDADLSQYFKLNFDNSVLLKEEDKFVIVPK